jgi:hypothetical protein
LSIPPLATIFKSGIRFITFWQLHRTTSCRWLRKPSLVFALRASLRLFKFAPGEFVDSAPDHHFKGFQPVYTVFITPRVP